MTEKQMRTNACLYLCVEYFDAWQGNAISQVIKAPTVLKPFLSIRPCARACDSLSSIFFTRRMWMLIILLSHQLKNFPIFRTKLGRWSSSSFSIGNILPVKLLESAPAQQRTMPFFVRKQKRRRSLHLSMRGSRLPLNDKHKRPTPQTGCCLWSYNQRPTKKSA